MSASDAASATKTAFVFAGGGSFGAIQVGMLQSLAAHGITADMVVGSSVGALNGAFYASDPTPAGVERLAKIWRGLTRHDVFPITWKTMLGFLWRRDFLIPHDGVRKLVEDNIPFRNLEEAPASRAYRGDRHHHRRRRGDVGRPDGRRHPGLDLDPRRVLADPLRGSIPRRRGDLEQYPGPGRGENGRKAADRAADRTCLRQRRSAGRRGRQRAACADAADRAATGQRTRRRSAPTSNITWCRRYARWWARLTISRAPPIISTAPSASRMRGWPRTGWRSAKSRMNCGPTITNSWSSGKRCHVAPATCVAVSCRKNRAGRRSHPTIDYPRRETLACNRAYISVSYPRSPKPDIMSGSLGALDSN